MRNTDTECEARFELLRAGMLKSRCSSGLLLALATHIISGCDPGERATQDAFASDASTSLADAGAGCAPESTRCVDGRVATCEPETHTFGAPEDCPPGTFCTTDACTPVSDTLIAEGDTLEAYAQYIVDFTGTTETLPMSTALAEARHALYQTRGEPRDFAVAVSKIFQVNPVGHAALGFGAEDWSACEGTATPYSSTAVSLYGACARASGGEAVITGLAAAASDNVLGLHVGERVVSVTRHDGEVWAEGEVLAHVDAEPLCRASVPTRAARVDVAAASLFAVLRPGDVLRVASADGTTRDITVGAAAEHTISCADPMRRDSRVHASSVYQRPDGVVVVVLPTLGNHSEHPFPTPLTNASYRTWIAESITTISDAVHAFSGVTGLVYDLRGNGGGAPEYGMALLGQMPEAEGSIGNCYGRVARSAPPEFRSSSEYPFPYASLGGTNLPPPPVAGLPGTVRQAVITDGLTYSAADWTAWRARRLGIAVVGRPASGAFGYTVGTSYVHRTFSAPHDEHADVLAYIAGARCVDERGMPIEGSAQVDTMVEFTAHDLEAGIDTQLEAAVAIVLGD